MTRFSFCLPTAAARISRLLDICGVLLLVGMLSAGCATENIIVSEVAITDRADAPVVGWTASETGQYVFSPEVEEITVKVLFEFNYRGVYEWYKVEWIAPGGVTYQELSRRTDFGSHRDLKASLKVRGKMASRLPGLWRVRIWLRGREGAADRELVSRLFRIAEPDAPLLAAGLTPVDVPDSQSDRPLAGNAPVRPVNSSPAPVSKSSESAAAVVVSAQVSASPVQPKPLPATPPGVLPPLAVSGQELALVQKNASVADAPANKQATANRESARSGLQRTRTPRTKRPVATSQPVYQGCPPLYYRPGPDCIEQAPEE